MEISRAANSYQQIANQSNVINADKSMIESRNQSLSQIKDKVDITLPKNLSDQSVKVLNCQDGSKALMTFAEKDKTVSCYVQDANGKMTAIKTENLPQSLKSIDTAEKFNGYMNNAYAKTSVLSDGDIKVDVSQQLKGGVMSSLQMQKKAAMQQSQSPERQEIEQRKGIRIQRGDALIHRFTEDNMQKKIANLAGNLGVYVSTHSSIYVGKDRVIGVTNKNGIGVVEEVGINEDQCIGKFPRKDVYTLEQVAKRAEGRARAGDTMDYSLIRNNCHHFTNWCQTNQTNPNMNHMAKYGGYH